MILMATHAVHSITRISRRMAARVTHLRDVVCIERRRADEGRIWPSRGIAGLAVGRDPALARYERRTGREYESSLLGAGSSVIPRRDAERVVERSALRVGLEA